MGSTFPLLFVFLLLPIALTYSSSRIKGRILLPLLFTAVAALDAVRHIPIFILIAIPVIAAAMPSSSASPLLSPPPSVPKRTRAILNFAALVFLALFAILRWVNLAGDQQAREAVLFPQRAVEFLQTTQEPERLFAYYDWGGYAIWKLGPKYRVFADGRADLYGDDLLRQCIEIVPRLQKGWQEVLEASNVQTILVPPSSALAQALFLDFRWTAAYRDHQAVIFIRARPIQMSRSVRQFGLGIFGKNVYYSHPESAKLVAPWNGFSVAWSYASICATGATGVQRRRFRSSDFSV